MIKVISDNAKCLIDLAQENVELRTQLAEKDKEILKWKDGTIICNYEKMLAEKDKELKQKNKTIKRLTRYNDELANALVEKPEQEELYQLREDNKVLTMKRDNYVKAKLQDQRHQICENIREKVKYSAIIITDKTLTQKERLLIKEQFDDDKETIYDILDQIEKGE